MSITPNVIDNLNTNYKHQKLSSLQGNEQELKDLSNSDFSNFKESFQQVYYQNLFTQKH